MADPVRTIAADIVTAFNAETWSPALVATRHYVVDVDAVTTTLAASVMGTAWSADIVTRGRDRTAPAVGIAIHQRVADTTVDTLDPLADLLDAVRHFFQHWKSPSTGAVCTSRKSEPLYNEKLLREHRVFLAFIELEFLSQEPLG